MFRLGAPERVDMSEGWVFKGGGGGGGDGQGSGYVQGVCVGMSRRVGMSYPMMHVMLPTSRGQTHNCENITFSQLLLRVKPLNILNEPLQHH